MFNVISSGLEFWSVIILQYMKILNQKYLKISSFLVKYLIIDQMIYLEQMYTIRLNVADNYC